MSGKSDPYVKLYMDIENQDKTATVNDNLNPEWNHETYFKVYEERISTIQFNVST
jgi:Ca2+-dependent lipid-binding protein